MKLFAIGDYDQYGCFGIIMAETKEEAFHKMAKAVIEYEKDVNMWKDEEFPNNEEEIIKIYTSNIQIKEIENGIFLGENC